ncbi:MAG: hypothetical protein ACLFQW_07995 [Spirochaetaceae bacterium]
MAFLTKRQLKFYLVGVGLVTLLALLITAVVMLLGGSAGDSEASERGARDTRPAETGTSTAEAEIFSAEERIMSQMEVPEEYKELFESRWKPFRPVYEKWSPGQIEPFWIDPKIIVEEQLKKESNRAVRDFLEELP